MNLHKVFPYLSELRIFNTKSLTTNNNYTYLRESNSLTLYPFNCNGRTDVQNMVPQAGPQDTLMVTQANAASDTKVLHFAEGIPGSVTSVVANKDDTFRVLEGGDDSLGAFLSRPIRVVSLDWNVSTQITFATYNIFNLFVTNPRIANRLNNFAYLNGTMNVRVVISGIPQYYGLAIVALNPWFKVDSNFTAKGGMANPTLNQLVQLPHLFIDPSTQSAGEMSIPLLTPFNAINLLDSTIVDDILALQIMSFTSLGNVGIGITPAHISVWAWMTDVQLTNPTATDLPYLTPQSGDEYGKAPISKAATTASNYAKILSNVPVIGPYARASEMILSNVASTAELFGYSRPNVNKAEMPMQIKSIGNLASSNFEDTAVKLTVDCKNEVTIDPCVVGAWLNDEMTLASIASRTGYLGNMQWDITQSSTTVIGRIAVTPSASRIVTNTGLPPVVNNIIDFTPATFAALAFRNWRGSMKYRFIVNCSAFHKGRLRFTYDPKGPLGILPPNNDWTNEYNTVQSHILDLSESKELILTIPWASDHSYLLTELPGVKALFDFTSPNSLGMSADMNYWNGTLGVTVLTQLVSPENLGNVRISVFVSAGDDIEFQEPSPSFANYMFRGWSPQSGEDFGADVLTGTQTLEPETTDSGVEMLNTM